MIDITKIAGFDWDEANLDKSYVKHGITASEAEKLFLDDNLLLQEDVKHSQLEDRFIAIGKVKGNKILFAAFTIRDDKIRVISVRIANRKERIKYEKT